MWLNLTKNFSCISSTKIGAYEERPVCQSCCFGIHWLDRLIQLFRSERMLVNWSKTMLMSW